MTTTTPISVTVGDTSGINFVATTTNIKLTKADLFGAETITSTLTTTTLGELGQKIVNEINAKLLSQEKFNELFTNNSTSESNIAAFAEQLGGIEANQIQSIETNGSSITITPKHEYKFALTGEGQLSSYAITGANSTGSLVINGLTANDFVLDSITPVEKMASSGFETSQATQVFTSAKSSADKMSGSSLASGSAATVTVESQVLVVTSNSGGTYDFISLQLPTTLSSAVLTNFKAMVGSTATTLDENSKVVWGIADNQTNNFEIATNSSNIYLTTKAEIGTAGQSQVVKLWYKASTNAGVQTCAGFIDVKFVVNN